MHVLEELRRNDGKRIQHLHSVEEFLDSMFIYPMEIARNVLARTPEQQEQVDEVGKMLGNLIREGEEKTND